MAASHHNSEGRARSSRMLRTALGGAITRLLDDPGVVEVMLNPDGRIWVDRLSEGLADTTERLASADGERIIRLVAHHVGAEVHAGAPRVSAELPDSGERFEGLLPPVVTAPAFAIRKPAVAVFSLDDYVAAGIMTARQAEALCVGVAERANILVAGGTSTGKTTLTNALLAEMARTSDRVVIIEDTRELQAQHRAAHGRRAEIETTLAQIRSRAAKILTRIEEDDDAPRSFSTRLKELETEEERLKEELATLPAQAIVRLPANYQTVYRTAIAELEQQLATKDAASSRNAIRALIDTIVVHAGDSRGGKVRRLELHGDLYRMLEFTEEAGSSGAQKRKQPQAGGLGAVSVTPVVAGAGFEPATFRL